MATSSPPPVEEARDPGQTGRHRFGLHLRQSRRACALSREEVARSTCIPLRTLALLEEGEFDELPAEVFVRGFLRAYAERVGIDPDSTLRAYDECRGQPAQASRRKQDGQGTTGRRQGLSNPSIVQPGPMHRPLFLALLSVALLLALASAVRLLAW